MEALKLCCLGRHEACFNVFNLFVLCIFYFSMTLRSRQLRLSSALLALKEGILGAHEIQDWNLKQTIFSLHFFSKGQLSTVFTVKQLNPYGHREFLMLRGTHQEIFTSSSTLALYFFMMPRNLDPALSTLETTTMRIGLKNYFCCSSRYSGKKNVQQNLSYKHQLQTDQSSTHLFQNQKYTIRQLQRAGESKYSTVMY